MIRILERVPSGTEWCLEVDVFYDRPLLELRLSLIWLFIEMHSPEILRNSGPASHPVFTGKLPAIGMAKFY